MTVSYANIQTKVPLLQCMTKETPIAHKTCQCNFKKSNVNVNSIMATVLGKTFSQAEKTRENGKPVYSLMFLEETEHPVIQHGVLASATSAVMAYHCRCQFHLVFDLTAGYLIDK